MCYLTSQIYKAGYHLHRNETVRYAFKRAAQHCSSSTPPPTRASVCGLHVLTVFVWVISRYSTFLPQSSEVSGVRLQMVVSLSALILRHICNQSMVYPASRPVAARRGFTLHDPDKSKRMNEWMSLSGLMLPQGKRTGPSSTSVCDQDSHCQE